MLPVLPASASPSPTQPASCWPPATAPPLLSLAVQVCQMLRAAAQTQWAGRGRGKEFGVFFFQFRAAPPRPVDSSFPDQGSNLCPHIGRQSLNDWTTEESTGKDLFFSLHQFSLSLPSLSSVGLLAKETWRDQMSAIVSSLLHSYCSF